MGQRIYALLTHTQTNTSRRATQLPLSDSQDHRVCWATCEQYKHPVVFVGRDII